MGNTTYLHYGTSVIGKQARLKSVSCYTLHEACMMVYGIMALGEVAAVAYLDSGSQKELVMIQTVQQNPLSKGFKFRGQAEAPQALSPLVIPAVPGEYYAYSSEFTKERPLYALMKCKASKNRPIAAANDLGHEANLLFLLGSPTRVQICSVRTAHAFGLLGNSVSGESFGETWIAPAGLTSEDFYALRSRMDVGALVDICQAACLKRGVSIMLDSRAVIATMTSGGKYGLFFVNGFTPTSIQIDACHILLPSRN